MKKTESTVVVLIVVGLSLGLFWQLQDINRIKVEKQAVVLNHDVEGAPFTWKNNVYYVRANRAHPGRLEIYDLKTNKLLTSYGEALTMHSVFVEKGTLYSYGSKNIGQPNAELYVITSKDLKTFSEPKLIYKAKEKQSFFNTSVTRAPGRYIMTLEVAEPNLDPFSIRFLESKDLMTWKVLEPIFGKEGYQAAPTIRYMGNYFYLWYLEERLDDPKCRYARCVRFFTRVTRSHDLVNWETSPKIFLQPETEEDQINASDVDFTEHDGKTYMVYTTGNQSTVADMRWSLTNATLKSIAESYFK